jgi:hypothetical protein
MKMEIQYWVGWPVLNIEMSLDRIGLSQGEVSRAACVAWRRHLRTLRNVDMPTILFEGTMLEKKSKESSDDWPSPF